MADYARRKGHRLMSQINVVPYIDVMLVLLVIFMVTAPLITTTVIDLPSISRSNAPPAAPMEIIDQGQGRDLRARPRARPGASAASARTSW